MLFLYSAGVAIAAENEQVSHILYINSYHPGYSWGDGIEQGLRDSLKASGKEFRLSIEYLDSRHYSAVDWQDRLGNVIMQKYDHFPQDLVIVSDNAAFDFATKNREHFFPNTPLVFCGYNNFRPELIAGLKNVTGVNEEVDIDSLVGMALSIQPETKTLAFVLSESDLSSKSLAEKIQHVIVPKYRNRYDIVLFNDASLAQIREGLTLLPPNSILFLAGINSDMLGGRAILPEESARMILEVSPVPAYTLWDYHLGLGVLGGRVLTGYEQGKVAADLALQILNGSKASSLPVLMQSPVSNIFDYQVMKRFGIKVDSLPQGSMLINQPENFYTKNKRLVWITVGIFVVLSLFIIILSLNILKRIRAEVELRRHREHLETLVTERTVALSETNESLKNSEERLRALSDASFEGLLVVESGQVIDANTALVKMFGYGKPELIGMSPFDFIAPATRNDVKEQVGLGHSHPYETLGIKKDGTVFPVEICAAMFRYLDRQTQIIALRDLTKQKSAEKEVRLLRGILPICACCKKIRDDKGYWSQIEDYLKQRSDVNLSHGYCPECYQKELAKIHRKF